jgi:hypothetical protein
MPAGLQQAASGLQSGRAHWTVGTLQGIPRSRGSRRHHSPVPAPGFSLASVQEDPLSIGRLRWSRMRRTRGRPVQPTSPESRLGDSTPGRLSPRRVTAPGCQGRTGRAPCRIRALIFCLIGAVRCAHEGPFGASAGDYARRVSSPNLRRGSAPTRYSVMKTREPHRGPGGRGRRVRAGIPGAAGS